MRQREDYTRHVVVTLILIVAILVSFQIYIFREPARVSAAEKRDHLIAVTEGRGLFDKNCAMCHGMQGEGVDGPPLNDSGFLGSTADETIFSLISSGVPNTEMPAWNQAHGGPFTDAQVRALVAYLRSWEADAPDRHAMAMAGDPIEGLVLYNSTCIVCHGAEGQGTERAPALNDAQKLAQFDDDWYRETITEGRPAQGMPTWGTVLSPEQVSNAIALLRAWEQGITVLPPGPEEGIAEAVHMLGHGDLHAAEHALQDAIPGASGDVLAALNKAMAALEAGDADAAQEALMEAQGLLGVEMPADEHEDSAAHDDMGPNMDMHTDEAGGHND